MGWAYDAPMMLKVILICTPARPILLASLCAAALAGCSSLQPDAAPAPPGAMDALGWEKQLTRIARAQALPAVLLLGEQHDAAEHQQWERNTIETLARGGHLAALVLEMAHAGHDSRTLCAHASEGEVQSALQWDAAGWSWARYAPVVMAAVQAGVPVYGGNLSRTAMRGVMQQSHWEQHLESAAWERQREAIRTGHCGLLPQSQLTPMARIQLAKDERLAQTAKTLLQPGKTVLIVAGRGHVLRGVGIPTWLPPHISTGVAVAQADGAEPVLDSDRDWLVHTPAVTAKDHCAALQKQWQGGAPGAAPRPSPAQNP